MSHGGEEYPRASSVLLKRSALSVSRFSSIRSRCCNAVSAHRNRSPGGSPSSQPWQFVVITDKMTMKHLSIVGAVIHSVADTCAGVWSVPGRCLMAAWPGALFDVLNRIDYPCPHLPIRC